MKKYVKVIAAFDCDGNLTPKQITWDNGKEYRIDKISDIRYVRIGESTEIRYTCFISGKEKYLYFEETRWFVDAKSKKKRAV